MAWRNRGRSVVVAGRMMRLSIRGAQFGRQRTPEALLKDDLAILFTADLGPAISAVETFGASTRLSGQHRRRVSAFLQDIAGKGKQRTCDAAPFVTVGFDFKSKNTQSQIQHERNHPPLSLGTRK